MSLEGQAGPGHRGATNLGLILVQWKAGQGLKQKRMHFVAQKASHRGQHGEGSEGPVQSPLETSSLAD